MMFERIKVRQDAELKRDAFFALRSGTKLSNIQKNMMMYHLQKTQKRVMRAWLVVVKANNKKRMNLIRQRAAFQERPYLARPLHVMRNLLMYKAFRSIMLNSNRRKEYRFNR